MKRGPSEATRAPNRRLDSIQIMRGVAAMLVLVSHGINRVVENEEHVGELHLATALPNLVGFGAIGVDLFFIISGFVMALSVRRLTGARGARDFLVLRWVRIAPPYLVVTAALVLLLAFFGRTFDPSWRSFFNAVFFVPVADVDGYTTPPLDVGWTLSFEFTFYLAVAVMVALGLGRRLQVLAVILAGAALVGIIADPQPFILSWLTNPILLEFALGICAYWAWDSGLLQRGRVAQLALAAAAVVVLGVGFVVGVGDIPAASATLDASASAERVLLWGVPVFLLFVASLPHGREGAKGCPGRLARHLGDASYSLYLVHTLVFIVFGGLLQRLSSGALADAALIVGVAAATLAGLIFYRWVEAPVTEHIRRVMARRLRSGAHLPAGEIG